MWSIIWRCSEGGMSLYVWFIYQLKQKVLITFYCFIITTLLLSFSLVSDCFHYEDKGLKSHEYFTRYFSQQTFWLFLVGKSTGISKNIDKAQFYWSFPVSYDSEPACNLAVIIFINYTCVFPTVTCQNFFIGKGIISEVAR